MIRVKICGITNLDDALAAVKAGCDAIGFVFYKKSPRYVSPEQAAAIRRELPCRITVIGVFVNARERTVKRVARLCRLDMVQLHGDESPAFCRRFGAIKVVKAFRIRNPRDTHAIALYDTFGWLVDSFSAGSRGGTGKCFDWSIPLPAAAGRKVVFLSGGLNNRNVAAAIRRFKPQWVDVSSSVEQKPGKKDRRMMETFIAATRRL